MAESGQRGEGKMSNKHRRNQQIGGNRRRAIPAISSATGPIQLMLKGFEDLDLTASFPDSPSRKRLTCNEQKILDALLSGAVEQREVHGISTQLVTAGLSVISSATKIERRSVRRALRSLIEAGLIEIVRASDSTRATTYRVLTKKTADKAREVSRFESEESGGAA